MLVHRLRRWPNIEPTIAQCLVFAGMSVTRPSSVHDPVSLLTQQGDQHTSHGSQLLSRNKIQSVYQWRPKETGRHGMTSERRGHLVVMAATGVFPRKLVFCLCYIIYIGVRHSLE